MVSTRLGDDEEQDHSKRITPRGRDGPGHVRISGAHLAGTVVKKGRTRAHVGTVKLTMHAAN